MSTHYFAGVRNAWDEPIYTPPVQPRRHRYGDALRLLREEQGLRAADVLARLRAMGHEVPKSQFTKWENDDLRPPVRMQWWLAQALRVPFGRVLAIVEGLPIAAEAVAAKGADVLEDSRPSSSLGPRKADHVFRKLKAEYPYLTLFGMVNALDETDAQVLIEEGLGPVIKYLRRRGARRSRQQSGGDQELSG